jgi:hypothetical protein
MGRVILLVLAVIGYAFLLCPGVVTRPDPLTGSVGIPWL